MVSSLVNTWYKKQRQKYKNITCLKCVMVALPKLGYFISGHACDHSHCRNLTFMGSSFWRCCLCDQFWHKSTIFIKKIPVREHIFVLSRNTYSDKHVVNKGPFWAKKIPFWGSFPPPPKSLNIHTTSVEIPPPLTACPGISNNITIALFKYNYQKKEISHPCE